MNDFVAGENFQSAFFGQKRRRESDLAPKWSIFGALFAIFEEFFAKSGPFFAKIEGNWAVFDDFEKGAVVFALLCEVLQPATENKDLRRFYGTENKDLRRFYGTKNKDLWMKINHEWHPSTPLRAGEFHE